MVSLVGVWLEYHQPVSPFKAPVRPEPSWIQTNVGSSRHSPGLIPRGLDLVGHPLGAQQFGCGFPFITANCKREGIASYNEECWLVSNESRCNLGLSVARVSAAPSWKQRCVEPSVECHASHTCPCLSRLRWALFGRLASLRAPSCAGSVRPRFEDC